MRTCKFVGTESARDFFIPDTTSSSSRSEGTGGIQMLLAIEINFALWGMIVCAAIEATQYFEVF
jgi:hypothetical protein